MPRLLCCPVPSFGFLGLHRIAGARDGATAIEYALIAGVIAAAILGVVTAIGNGLASIFVHLGTIAAAAVS
jgi:Flp pilus assembly pilin Flp